MDRHRIEELKKKLTEEKKLLEEELSSVAKKDPEHKNKWEVSAPDMGSDGIQEQDELADKFEELENIVSRERPLTERLGEVNAALERINSGTYGLCLECGVPIPQERLEANPAAAHDMKHAQ